MAVCEKRKQGLGAIAGKMDEKKGNRKYRLVKGEY